MNRAQEAEQAAHEKARVEQSRRQSRGLDYLFNRPDIPEKLKKRFWAYSDVRDLRLGHIENYDNIKVLKSCLERDILIYFQEKGEELTHKQVSWLNQLYFHFMINLTGSLGKEERDMSLMLEERVRSETTYETPMPEEGEK